MPENFMNGQQTKGHHFAKGVEQGIFSTLHPPYASGIEGVMAMIEAQMPSAAASFTANAPSTGEAPLELKRAVAVIGCGGTGCEVATGIKLHMGKRLKKLPTNVAFLGFDSGPETKARYGDDGQRIELKAESEMIRLGAVPVSGIKLNPHFHPEIMAQMGQTLAAVGRGYLSGGAAGQRKLGQLYGLFNAPIIANILRDTLRRLTQRRADLSHPTAGAQGMDIIVIASTAGGQGAGILFLVTMLIREILQGLGEWADASRIIGVLALPSIFGNLPNQPQGRFMHAGTHALGQELPYFQQNGLRTFTYPGNLQVEMVEPLFDNLIAIEGVDARGLAWPSASAVCDMTARALELLFFRDIGQLERAIALPQWESTTGAINLSSLGVFELRFPVQPLLNLFSVRQARAMTRHALDEQATPKTLAPAIDIDFWLHQLNGAIDPALFQLPTPPYLEQASPGEMPARARAYADAQLQNRHLATLLAQTQQVAEQLQGATEESLASWLSQIGAAGQVVALNRGLEAGLRRAQTASETLQAMQKAIGEELKQQDEVLKAADRAMNEAADSLWVGRGQRTLAAVHEYLDARSQQAQHHTHQRCLFHLSALLHMVVKWYERHLMQVNQVEQRLRQATLYLSDAEARLATLPDEPHALNIVKEHDVERLFVQYAHAPAADLQAAINGEVTQLLALGESAPRQLIHTLLTTAHGSFQPLRALSIESVMQSLYPERTAADWLALLEEQVAPAINYERAKIPPGAAGLVSFLMMGMPNANDTIFTGVQQTLTSTGDPHRIVALNTLYGVPFNALKSAPIWQRAYDALPAAVQMMLHTLPHFHKQEQDVDALFMVGRIFGLITENNGYYTYHPADKLAKGQRLGKGLENALAAFATQPELAGEARTRITSCVAENGKASVRTQILAYLEELQLHPGSMSELTLRLLQAARLFAEALA